MVKGFSLGLVFSAMLLIARKFEWSIWIVWNSNVVTNLDTTLTCERYTNPLKAPWWLS